MIKTVGIKLIFSIIIIISFFINNDVAGIGIIVGSIFIIKELIQRNKESIVIFFILMYLYVGLKSVPEFALQFIEAMSQDGEGRGVFIFILPQYFFEYNVGVFDLSIPFILTIFFFSFFSFVLFTNSKLLSGIPNFVIILFFLVFLPTLIGFILAVLEDSNGALAPMKCLFSLSIVFFGYAYARIKNNDVIKILLKIKDKYIYILALLLIVGLMYNHILFIYLGLAASVAVYNLLFEKKLLKFSVLLLSIILGTLNNTFTIMLIPLVSGLITFLSIKYLSFKMRAFMPKIGFAIFVIFLAFVLSAPKQEIQLQNNTTTEGRLYNKIYGDRYFVWSSYMEEIKNANPFFVVPKETIKLETVNETERDIRFGAHNTLIQLLYYFGTVFGSILFFILFFIINKMVVNSKFLPKYIQAIALGLFGVFIVFGLTGHSIITHAASMFFWLFVGLITGLGEHMKQLNNSAIEVILPKREYEL